VRAQIRHMVNNCCEERHVWNDIGALSQIVVSWHSNGGDNEDEDEDEAYISTAIHKAIR
jgi:hypothetical protein